MKKFSLIMAGALALAVTAGLAACGGRPGDPAMNSITCAENENYRVIDLAEQGQTGSDILFDVASESVFYEIGEVSYNGTPITKGSLGYKFTMPDADVTIEIDLTPVTEYDDPDDYLSWGSGVIDQISVASEEDKGYEYLECTQEIPLSFDMNKFGLNNNTLDRKEILIPVTGLKSAFSASYNYLYNETKSMLIVLKQLFTGKIPLKNMHGVVLITKMGGDIISSEGIFYGLLLTAVISMNLAILNILPIPALDGGHLLFLLVEKIQGKPVDEEVSNKIMMVFFSLLILLLVFVLFNDLYVLIQPLFVK